MICSPARSRDSGAPILPRALRRDIILILLVKIALLIAIAQVFFHPAGNGHVIDAKAVTLHLFSTSPGEVDGSR